MPDKAVAEITEAAKREALRVKARAEQRGTS